jgi:TnpA family transposase
MARRDRLTPEERKIFTDPPHDPELIARTCTFGETELRSIAQCRGDHNRLGFAVVLAYMKYPGIAMPTDAEPPLPLLQFIAEQISVGASHFAEYAERPQTRREHIAQIKKLLGVRAYKATDRQAVLACVQDIALKTDKGAEVAGVIARNLRQWNILLPEVGTIQDLCSEAITDGERRLNAALTGPLKSKQKRALDQLLEKRPHGGGSVFAWLKQSFPKVSAGNILSQFDRFNLIKNLAIPQSLRRKIPESRLQKLARFAHNADASRMRELRPESRYAVLSAYALESYGDVLDDALDLHDRMISNLHSSTRAKSDRDFVEAKKSIKPDLILGARIARALVQCHDKKTDPYEAILKFTSLDALKTMAERGEDLVKSRKYEPLPLVRSGFRKIHRYAGTMLDAITVQASPAGQPILDALEAVKRMHHRKVSDSELPDEFITGKWGPLVKTKDGIDRQFYELCALSRMRDALRNGDLWIEGSKRYRNLEEYFLAPDLFAAHKQTNTLEVGVPTLWSDYANSEVRRYCDIIRATNTLAQNGALPGVSIDEAGLAIEKLEGIVPAEADALRRKLYGLMPARVKITDILIDMDQGERISRHFLSFRTGRPHPNKRLLWTTILAEATNLGFGRMAEACREKTSFKDLSEVYQEYISDEGYDAALAEMAKIYSENEYTKIWGAGLNSSSDGQWFPAAGLGYDAGGFNPHRGSEPGLMLYTHIRDDYFPFRKRPMVSVACHEAPYVLDAFAVPGIGSRIIQHSTDTGGFSDMVFGGAELLGVDYAPHIRNIDERRVCLPPGMSAAELPGLRPILGKHLNVELLEFQWDELLRVGASMSKGIVMPSVILRKLNGYRRQNSLAAGQAELGRLKRSFHMLKWISNPEFRRKVPHILNKGEAFNKLTRALVFNRNGEFRDRTYEGQKYRANALNLLGASIVVWNARGLSHITGSLTKMGHEIDRDLLSHVSPTGWEHINLIGVYEWNLEGAAAPGGFRPLRGMGA